MKIGILTLLDEKNYGNRWQNFAMNKLLQSKGIDTENIYIWERNTDRSCFREKVKRILPLRMAYLAHVISVYHINNICMLKRVLKFMIFTHKYMKSKLVLVNRGAELKNKFDVSGFDYFVVGSDQVWNPYYVSNPIFFLNFVNIDKRLAFMASFGCDEIPKMKRKSYANWLSEMNYISVREPSGKNIVKLLTGKEADIFLDPVLLLERDKWVSLGKKPKKFNMHNNYAVTFMFNREIDDIKKFCSENKLELIILNSVNNKKYYALDPTEMIYVINNAKIVFTDSFHIMAISIKLNKQFYVFQRNGFEYMFNRLKSTLERLSITQCIYEKEMCMTPILDEQYDTVNIKLQMEKERFLETVNNIIV